MYLFLLFGLIFYFLIRVGFKMINKIKKKDNMTNTLKENLVNFLVDNPSNLKQIYGAFPKEKETTIRGRLNENINKCFKRIYRGIYLATSGNAQALIIEGDAWEEVKNIESNSIDAIITDSPYTSLDKYYKVGTTRKRNLQKSVGFKTKDIDKILLKEFYRVLKVGGHFFSFLPADAKGTKHKNDYFIFTSEEVGFIFNKRFIWDKKCIGMGYNGRSKYEQIIFLSKEKRTMPRDRSIPDLLSHKRISPSKRIHVAQKPNELIKDLIKFCSNENDVIFDPFAGSLVLAEECLKNKRNNISIEIDKEMIDKSIKERNLKEGVIIK